MQPRILLVACFVVISALVLPSEERILRRDQAATDGPGHAKRVGTTPKHAGSDLRRDHPMATLKERAMLKRHENAENHGKRGVGHPKDAGVNLQRSKFGGFDEFSYGDGNNTDEYSSGYSYGYAWAQSDNYYGMGYDWYYDVCPSRDPSLDDEYRIGECDGYLYYMTYVNESYDRYSSGYSDGYSWAQYDNSSGDHWYNDWCKDIYYTPEDKYFNGYCDGYLYYMTYGGDYQYGDGNNSYDYDYDYYDGYWSGFWDGFFEAEYDKYWGYEDDWYYDTYCGDYDYYSDDEYRSGFCDGYRAYKEGFLDGHSEGYSDAWHDIISYYYDLHYGYDSYEWCYGYDENNYCLDDWYDWYEYYYGYNYEEYDSDVWCYGYDENNYCLDNWHDWYEYYYGIPYGWNE